MPSHQGSNERRVTSGTPLRIRSGEFNAWQDASRRINAMIRTGLNAPFDFGVAQYSNYRAQNSTMLDLVRGSIVDFGAVGGSLPVQPPDSEFFFRPALTVKEPQVANTTIGVVVQPMKNQDDFGHVAVSGVHAVMCDVIDTAHKFWDLVPTSGDDTVGEITHVQSSEGGGRGELIWHTGSTGVVEALIRLSVVPGGRFDGLATAAVDQCECNFDVEVLSSIQPPTPDIESVVSVVNKFHWDIDLGALVAAEWNSYRQQWEAYQVVCPGNSCDPCVDVGL